MTRDEALALARNVREARIDLIERLGSGEIGLRDVMESRDALVTVVKVVAVIESLPGLGKVAARRILDEEGIPGDCKIRELDEHQTKALLDRVGA